MDLVNTRWRDLQLQRPLSSPKFPHGQGFIAFLSFTHVSLKSLIQKPYDFKPKYLGDHVRSKRLEMGLTQKEVADQLGVVPWTILNWEKDRTEPPIKPIPAIVQFLGYDPLPEPTTLPQSMFAKRREMGWSIKDAAEAVGVDPATWGNWASGQTIAYRKHLALIARLLGLSIDALNEEMTSNSNRQENQSAEYP